MYVDAVGPSLRVIAAILDADWLTLLFTAADGGSPAAPIAVRAERTGTGLVLDQRRDVALSMPLRRWLGGVPEDRARSRPSFPRALRHDGARSSLVLPLAPGRHAEPPSAALLLLERRGHRPFSDDEAALARRLASRLEAALARGRIAEAARARLGAALAMLGSGEPVRDVSRAMLGAVATWTGARGVALHLPPIRVGMPGVTAAVDSGGAFAWEEGVVLATESAAASSQGAGGPRIEIAWMPDQSDGEMTATARATIPLLDGVAASLVVSWDSPAGALGLECLAAAANVAAPVVVHLGERLARDVDRRRMEEVAGTMGRIAAAPDAPAALRALLAGATSLARAEGASIRLERGVFGENPAFINILRHGDGSVEWTDIAVASDWHTDEALRLGGASRVVDLVAESEDGNVLARQLLHDYGFESGMIVPIRARGLVVGTLRLASRRRRAFDGMAGLPLQALADHAGSVVEQALLETEAAERARRLRVAQHIAAAVNAADDLDGIARRLLDAAMAATGSDGGSVALVEADGSALRTRARSGVNGPTPDIQRLLENPRHDGGTQEAVPMTAQRVVDAPMDGGDGAPHARTVLTPIMHSGVPIGVLSLTWEAGHATGATNLELARVIADQAGGAIARTRVAQSERSARAALTTALEASSTVILTLSVDGVVTGVEGDTTTMLGLPAPRLVGLPFLDLLAPGEQGASVESLISSGARDVKLQVQTRARHQDGRLVPVLVVGAFFEGDRHLGAAVAMTDLTKMTELTEELDEANAARARAEGAVRTGRAIAHDLGSPLSSILALSELLVEDVRLHGQARSDMEMLSTEAVRASTLLHRFGRITRYEELLTPAGPQLDVDRSTQP